MENAIQCCLGIFVRPPSLFATGQPIMVVWLPHLSFDPSYWRVWQLCIAHLCKMATWIAKNIQMRSDTKVVGLTSNLQNAESLKCHGQSTSQGSLSISIHVTYHLMMFCEVQSPNHQSSRAATWYRLVAKKIYQLREKARSSARSSWLW